MIKAAIQISERLQTTTYIKFWPSRKPVSNYLLKNSDCVCPWEPQNVRQIRTKKYFSTFRINQIIFAYGEKKKERPYIYLMFSQNLPISAAFTAILKMNCVLLPWLIRKKLHVWDSQQCDGLMASCFDARWLIAFLRSSYFQETFQSRSGMINLPIIFY